MSSLGNQPYGQKSSYLTASAAETMVPQWQEGLLAP